MTVVAPEERLALGYAPPGHTPTLYAGTEVVEFSPTLELQQTIEVVTRNMGAAGA